MMMVLSRLDYGNATLAGLPGNQLDRLQGYGSMPQHDLFALHESTST